MSTVLASIGSTCCATRTSLFFTANTRPVTLTRPTTGGIIPSERTGRGWLPSIGFWSWISHRTPGCVAVCFTENKVQLCGFWQMSRAITALGSSLAITLARSEGKASQGISCVGSNPTRRGTPHRSQVLAIASSPMAQEIWVSVGKNEGVSSTAATTPTTVISCCWVALASWTEATSLAVSISA